MVYMCLFLSVFFFLMRRRPPRSTRTDTLFPTRRSSDLQDQGNRNGTFGAGSGRHQETARRHAQGRCHHIAGQRGAGRDLGQIVELAQQRDGRSEEHTSELQSLMRISYAVFCLKKKKKTEIY